MWPVYLYALTAEPPSSYAAAFTEPMERAGGGRVCLQTPHSLRKHTRERSGGGGQDQEGILFSFCPSSTWFSPLDHLIPLMLSELQGLQGCCRAGGEGGCPPGGTAYSSLPRPPRLPQSLPKETRETPRFSSLSSLRKTTAGKHCLTCLPKSQGKSISNNQPSHQAYLLQVAWKTSRTPQDLSSTQCLSSTASSCRSKALLCFLPLFSLQPGPAAGGGRGGGQLRACAAKGGAGAGETEQLLQHPPSRTELLLLKQGRS